jgi:LPXTG-motif cell wall-anchored protein
LQRIPFRLMALFFWMEKMQKFLFHENRIKLLKGMIINMINMKKLLSILSILIACVIIGKTTGMSGEFIRASATYAPSATESIYMPTDFKNSYMGKRITDSEVIQNGPTMIAQVNGTTVYGSMTMKDASKSKTTPTAYTAENFSFKFRTKIEVPDGKIDPMSVLRIEFRLQDPTKATEATDVVCYRLDFTIHGLAVADGVGTIAAQFNGVNAGGWGSGETSTDVLTLTNNSTPMADFEIQCVTDSNQNTYLKLYKDGNSTPVLQQFLPVGNYLSAGAIRVTPVMHTSKVTFEQTVFDDHDIPVATQLPTKTSDIDTAQKGGADVSWSPQNFTNRGNSMLIIPCELVPSGPWAEIKYADAYQAQDVNYAFKYKAYVDGSWNAPASFELAELMVRQQDVTKPFYQKADSYDLYLSSNSEAGVISDHSASRDAEISIARVSGGAATDTELCRFVIPNAFSYDANSGKGIFAEHTFNFVVFSVGKTTYVEVLLDGAVSPVAYAEVPGDDLIKSGDLKLLNGNGVTSVITPTDKVSFDPLTPLTDDPMKVTDNIYYLGNGLGRVTPLSGKENYSTENGNINVDASIVPEAFVTYLKDFERDYPSPDIQVRFDVKFSNIDTSTDAGGIFSLKIRDAEPTDLLGSKVGFYSCDFVVQTGPDGKKYAKTYLVATGPDRTGNIISPIVNQVFEITNRGTDTIKMALSAIDTGNGTLVQLFINGKEITSGLDNKYKLPAGGVQMAVTAGISMVMSDYSGGTVTPDQYQPTAVSSDPGTDPGTDLGTNPGTEPADQSPKTGDNFNIDIILVMAAAGMGLVIFKKRKKFIE